MLFHIMIVCNLVLVLCFYVNRTPPITVFSHGLNSNLALAEAAMKAVFCNAL